MRQRVHAKAPKGFSLIDLSIVITLASLAVAAFLLKDTGSDSQVIRSSDQVKQFEIIENTLADYLATNSYFPCPADPTLAITDANFGVASGTNTGTCSASNLLTDGGSPAVKMGAVPIRDLGLPTAFAFDQQGNRMFYAIQENMTLTNVSGCDISGSIIILNDYDDAETPLSQTGSGFITASDGAWVLLSTGKDGVGAYPNAGGSRITAQTVTGGFNNYADSTYQLLNHHLYDDSGTASYTESDFDKAFFQPQSTPTYVYDDILTYGTATIADTSSSSGSTVYVFSGGMDTDVKKIDASDGSTLWTYNAANYIYAVAADSTGNIYAGGEDDQIYKIDEDGTRTWTNSSNSHDIIALAVDTDDSAVYSAGGSGEISKANGSTGAGIWHVVTNASEDNFAIAVDDDYVYVGADNDVLYIRNKSDGTSVCSNSSTFTDGLESAVADNSGNVYLGDRDNKIYKINSSCSSVCTYAAGGTSYHIKGLAIDSSGYIYGSSTNGNVYKIDSSCSWVDTISGIHASNIYQVDVDSSGNLYTSNITDNTVKMSDSSGTVQWTNSDHTSAVADSDIYESSSSSSSGCSSSSSSSSSGGTVFVYTGGADNTLRKVDTSTGSQIWSFTSHTDDVTLLTVDSSDNTYSDGPGVTIRKVDADGTETWNAPGSGIDSGSAHYDIAVDSSGESYFGSQDNHVYKLDSSGTEDTTSSLPADASFDVLAVAVDSKNGIVWAATSNQEAFKFRTANGEEVCSVSTSGQGVRIALDADGNAYVGTSTGYVHKLDALDCTETWNFRPSTDTITGIVLDSSDNMYISMYDGATSYYVRKYNSAQTQQWSYTATTLVNDLDIDTSGNIYIGENDGTLRKLNTSGTEVTTDSWPNTDNGGAIYEIEVYDPSETVCCNFVEEGGTAATILYTGGGDDELRKWDVSSGAPVTYECTYTGADQIKNVDVDSLGNIYGGDASGNVVKLNSSCANQWTNTDLVAGTSALAVDSNGAAWAGDVNSTSSIAIKIDTTTGSTLVTKTDHSNDVTDIKLGVDSNLYSCSKDYDIKRRDTHCRYCLLLRIQDHR